MVEQAPPRKTASVCQPTRPIRHPEQSEGSGPRM